jgi:aryl-alcohol dehydrogenase-like predicted oxidoreductase
VSAPSAAAVLEHRPLGASGLEVPSLCLGTMTFGQQTDEREAHAQLDLALATGVNFVDTAELYPVPPRAETTGATEAIVGRWLARQRRDRILVATKVAGPGRSIDWIRQGPQAFDAANIRAALEGSLTRLKTDYVDLYQLHWPARNQPMFGQRRFDPTAERASTAIGEQLDALSALVKEGKVRAIGLSNEHPWGVMRFLDEAKQRGLPRVASIQNAYSLVNRTFEASLTEVCFRERVALLAYSPLAFGHLTGKYLERPDAPGRVTQFKGFGQRYEKPGLVEAVRAYADLAMEHGLTPTQLALAFVRSRWFVTSTIVGASSRAQLEEDLRGWATPLSAEVLERIDALHQRHGDPTP